MKYKIQSIFKFSVLIIVILGGLYLFNYTNFQMYTQPEMIRSMIEDKGIMGPIFYIVLYSVLPLVAFPGAVLSIVGGLVFGTLLGTLYTVIGATIGATGAFLLARYFGREFIAKFETLNKGKLKQFDDDAEKHGFTGILYLRLIPLVPFNALNFGAGLSKIKLKDYVLGTMIGIIPGTFAYNFIGGSLNSIFSVKFAIAALVFIIVGIVPVLIKKYK